MAWPLSSARVGVESSASHPADLKKLTIWWSGGVGTRPTRLPVFGWRPDVVIWAFCRPHRHRRRGGVGAALSLGVPSAPADPSTDALGFVDSTARCAAPDTAVAFGSTATSRVAICKTSTGKYEYHGVRISDGAKLVVPASASADGGYVAQSDGITYTVTSSSLVVSEGNQEIRTRTDGVFPRARKRLQRRRVRQRRPRHRRQQQRRPTQRRCRHRCPPKSAAPGTSSAPQPKSIGSRCNCRFLRCRVRGRSRCS